MCEFCQNHEQGDTLYEPSDWDGGIGFDYIRDIKYCPLCGRKLDSEDEPTISKMEQVDKDINVRSKDEPQPNADQHVQRIEYVGNDEKSRCWTCKHFERMHETPISSDGSYYTYVVCTAKECKYEPKDEPQPERSSE